MLLVAKQLRMHQAAGRRQGLPQVDCWVVANGGRPGRTHSEGVESAEEHWLGCGFDAAVSVLGAGSSAAPQGCPRQFTST